MINNIGKVIISYATYISNLSSVYFSCQGSELNVHM